MKLFLDQNLDLLESDDEEAEEAEGREVQMEDLFNPTREDHITEDAASALPLVVIVLLLLWCLQRVYPLLHLLDPFLHTIFSDSLTSRSHMARSRVSSRNRSK